MQNIKQSRNRWLWER